MNGIFAQSKLQIIIFFTAAFVLLSNLAVLWFNDLSKYENNLTITAVSNLLNNFPFLVFEKSYIRQTEFSL